MSKLFLIALKNENNYENTENTNENKHKPKAQAEETTDGDEKHTLRPASYWLLVSLRLI